MVSRIEEQDDILQEYHKGKPTFLFFALPVSLAVARTVDRPVNRSAAARLVQRTDSFSGWFV